jgi:hypothetical protein
MILRNTDPSLLAKDTYERAFQKALLILRLFALDCAFQSRRELVEAG